MGRMAFARTLWCTWRFKKKKVSGYKSQRMKERMLKGTKGERVNLELKLQALAGHAKM